MRTQLRCYCFACPPSSSDLCSSLAASKAALLPGMLLDVLQADLVIFPFVDRFALCAPKHAGYDVSGALGWGHRCLAGLPCQPGHHARSRRANSEALLQAYRSACDVSYWPALDSATIQPVSALALVKGRAVIHQDKHTVQGVPRKHTWSIAVDGFAQVHAEQVTRDAETMCLNLVHMLFNDVYLWTCSEHGSLDFFDFHTYRAANLHPHLDVAQAQK